MLLAQGVHWRAELGRNTAKAETATLSLAREGLPEEAEGARDLRIEVPLTRWNAAVKRARTDRKLLGGVLLDFANHKDAVAIAIACDRLWLELAGLVLDVTASLVAAEKLVLVVPEPADG